MKDWPKRNRYNRKPKFRPIPYGSYGYGYKY